MGKLSIIDASQFILEGEFEKIREQKGSILDEQSIVDSVTKYISDYVTPGKALGVLNEGFLTMPTADGDQVVAEETKEPAFMIIGAEWNSKKSCIEGQVVILNSPDGVKVKQAIQQGVDCYISSSETETYNAKEEGSSRILQKVSEVKGYKMSIMNFHSTI